MDAKFHALKERDEIIRTIAMPLIATSVDHTDCFAQGTAVAIAPYLLLTARHVIEDFIEKYGMKSVDGSAADPIEKNYDFPYMMLAHQITKEGDALWRVDKMWLSPFTDIAILLVSPFSEVAAAHKWRTIPIHAGPPAIGQSVVGFGFHTTEARWSEGHLVWKVDTATTTGQVTEVYPQRRDSTKPYPCFQTTARIDGSMSGGPFFIYENEADTSKGMQLCGLALSSFPSFGDGDVSFVTTLWPALGTCITAPRSDATVREPYPVLDLVREVVVDADRLIVKRTEEGVQVSYRQR